MTLTFYFDQEKLIQYLNFKCIDKIFQFQIIKKSIFDIEIWNWMESSVERVETTRNEFNLK